ncbi:nitrilase-related carbon-nitrogen hydrolase [Myroides injenensis]|uniref:nitrilase-related carbon-nitrogen hydrolase n=1 Tax=Myroides injenensis TaxID=1183151 RepID=UPI000288A38B|nr:nitrilase-related carbon-nitrogen hydrolase [Myroides injenensis]
MNVVLMQASLEWEDVNSNINFFINQLEDVADNVDLVVLPEMFSSGFTMHPERVALQMNDKNINKLVELARSKSFAIIGSLVVQENGNFYNRLLFIDDLGNIQSYDKRHLFSLAGEEKVYSAGKDRLIVNYKGWRICPLVCYDLRFPVYARNNKDEYDLLIYVASWPDQRIYAWDSLLKARAIENMCYTIGVNRSGVDENNNIYSGHSQVLDCFGKYMIEPQEGEQNIAVTLNLEELNKAKSKFKFLKDADDFHLNL